MTATQALPVLRTSERSCFKRCPWRWEQEYRYGYKPKATRQADALWFGIGVHEALAPWYGKGKRRGPHPADTFEQWAGDEIRYAKTWLDDNYEDAVWEDALELGIAMLEQYVDYYGKDSQWSIIAVERPFAITITRRGKPVAIFKSRWDGVLRSLIDGKIYLLEHKTASSITTAYLEIDDQGGSYLAVASHVLHAEGVLKDGEQIAGIIYNFLRKTMPDERPQDEQGLYHNKPAKEHYVTALLSAGIRTVEQSSPKSGPVPIEKATLRDLEAAAQFSGAVVLGEVSKNQPPAAFARTLVERGRQEHLTQLTRIADEVTVMNAMRTGKLPLFKTPTKDCVRCPFFEPCQLHERGDSRAYKALLRADYVQEDPYADYKSAAALCLILKDSSRVPAPDDGRIPAVRSWASSNSAALNAAESASRR
jgi:Zierdtviridae exonuclease